MEESLFTICVKIGQQMKFEFDGSLLSFDPDDFMFTFGEIEEFGIPKKGGDVIVLNLNKKAVALNSNHFSMALNILSTQKIGDNYFFKCATDICRVDVYVCEKTLWVDMGEAIFS